MINKFSNYFYSWSSESDFYTLLFSLDYVYEAYQRGDYDALCLYISFMEAIKNYPLCKLYAEVNCGIKPISGTNRDIYEHMSILTGVHPDDIKIYMKQEINDCIKEERKKLVISLYKKYNLDDYKKIKKTINKEENNQNNFDSKEKESEEIKKNNNLVDDYESYLREHIKELKEQIISCTDTEEKSRMIKSIKMANADLNEYLQKSSKKYFNEIFNNEDSLKDYGLIEFIDKLVEDLCTSTQYKIFYFRYVEGKKQNEVASILGMSQSNVSKNEQKIIEIIKTALGIID